MLNWPKLCLGLDHMNRMDRGSHFSTSLCHLNRLEVSEDQFIEIQWMTEIYLRSL